MFKKKVNYFKIFYWFSTNDPEYPFALNHKGHKLCIRVNDFPDEHLYTLIIDDLEVESFDNWPKNWNKKVA